MWKEFSFDFSEYIMALLGFHVVIMFCLIAVHLSPKVLSTTQLKASILKAMKEQIFLHCTTHILYWIFLDSGAPCGEIATNCYIFLNTTINCQIEASLYYEYYHDDISL